MIVFLPTDSLLLPVPVTVAAVLTALATTLTDFTLLATVVLYVLDPVSPSANGAEKA